MKKKEKCGTKKNIDKWYGDSTTTSNFFQHSTTRVYNTNTLFITKEKRERERETHFVFKIDTIYRFWIIFLNRGGGYTTWPNLLGLNFFLTTGTSFFVVIREWEFVKTKSTDFLASTARLKWSLILHTNNTFVDLNMSHLLSFTRQMYFTISFKIKSTWKKIVSSLMDCLWLFVIVRLWFVHSNNDYMCDMMTMNEK